MRVASKPVSLEEQAALADMAQETRPEQIITHLRIGGAVFGREGHAPSCLAFRSMRSHGTAFL